jgi:hypothetical protein
MKKLERGMTVMIYADPITREDFEGMGLLDEYLSTRYDGFERWTVWFRTDDGPHTRLINPKNSVTLLAEFKLKGMA